MKYLFHLGHPAHFHLFKLTIRSLITDGNEVLIAIKKKDVLEDLLKNEGFQYLNILPQGKKTGKFNLILTQLQQISALYRITKKEKVDILCGTSAAISIVGKIVGLPSYNFNEDDAEAVPLYAKMAYPWATKIFAPTCCSVGKWSSKKIAYQSYHELAYLHPNHFSANREIAVKYVDMSKPYFMIRFAQLIAHHDKNVRGISEELALQIIQKLEQKGNVYITSEISLASELKKYELQINPADIHHVMAFSSMFIGDSQTMSAESAVLGVPFIRFSDFVGRLSYLNELENDYQLGFGFKTNQSKEMLEQLDLLLSQFPQKELFAERRKKMLADKIDLSVFIQQQLLKQIS